MTAIRHNLQRDVFLPSDERLVGVAYVAKASKKKKTGFLCAVISTEKPIQVTIYQIKKSDKDTYKKKSAWPLRDLKIVDGKDEFKETAEFDLQFERLYKWIASSTQEKNAFITCLWKLCCHHLPRQKPNFINLPKSLFEETVPINDVGVVTEQLGGGQSMIETEDYEALTGREEADLERLMTQCEFAICNAEAFTEQLARELSVLDATNVHTIMASEQKMQALMQMLQEAIDEATQLENYLDAYDNMLKNVRDSVLHMKEKDALIQIQNMNNVKLLNELTNLINQLDLPHNHKMNLLGGDLKTPEGIIQCTAAAKALQNAMNAQIHPSLTKMAAYQEQRKLFEKLCSKLSSRMERHLTSLFNHLGNEHGETLSFFAQELTLPTHTACHNELLPYMELVHWLKISDYSCFSLLVEVYTSSLCKLYEKEIKNFFELAKERISGKSGADKRARVSGSSQDLGGKGSTKQWSSSLLGMDPEHFGSELDLAEREVFDKLIEQMLSALEPVCLAEQDFCIKFFGLGSEIHSSASHVSQLSNQPNNITRTPSSSNLSRTNSEELLSNAQKKQINEELRKMMAELFAVLEPELTNFITFYDKMDGFYSMYLLVRLSQHVMSAQDTGSFLSKIFGIALVQAKRNFDKFMLSQIKSIEEAKVSKKSKCGILPFVKNFEDFALQAETIFKESERRTDLDRWYTKLVHAMFDEIGRVAIEHQKTPQEVVLMENFHHLFTLLYQLKIGCLENERKEAKQKYNEALQAYVTHYFGRPLEKLNLFFEGVQSKVAQGVKEEEVGYQLAFSKQELRKVIKEYPGKEVKRGLENLYRKVEKHLCEEENLLQVVWHSMQDEFIRQYKYIESLIERCYPGSMIALEFSIVDILNFFSDIARSH